MKIFIVKLLVFVVMLFTAQTLISGVFIRSREDKVPRNILLMEQYLKENTDIIYFGDSVLFWPENPVPGMAISELLQELMPQYKVGLISHLAYTPDMYLEFCRFIVRKQGHPKLVIIPVNMRAFSPEWDMNPGYQFEKEKIFLKSGNPLVLSIFYYPLSVFKLFNRKISERDYNNIPVFASGVIAGKVSDFDNYSYRIWSESNMRNKIVLRYLYSLTARHRKVRSLVITAELLKKHGIPCVFYVTPLDYETAEKYAGAGFKDRVAENIALLKREFKLRGVNLLDFSFSLDSSFFNWKEFLYPNEHLTLKGKQFVAGQIAQEAERTLTQKSGAVRVNLLK